MLPAPSVLVEPKVLRVALLPKVPPLAAGAAAPNVLGAPKPALPNEVAGLVLALAPNPEAAPALGAAPKVVVWPNPEPLLFAAPRLLTAPKPEEAPNLGALFVLLAKGVAAEVVLEEFEPKDEPPNDVLPKVDAEGAAVEAAGVEPNRDTGFASFIGALAALLAKSELPVAGLLEALPPTPHPVPSPAEEPPKLTGAAGPGD